MNTLTTTDRHLVLCFQVHQPKRLRRLEDSEQAIYTSCFDEEKDRIILQRVANECYIPTNRLILKLVEQYPQIRIAFAISGTVLEQLEEYAPEALETFQQLAATGSVDFISEPYYHSLSFLIDSKEFEIQVLEHSEKILEHFQVRPTVFRNSNLIYNDEIGRRINMMGFEGVLIEGSEGVLKQNSAHRLYEHRDSNGLKILTRNHNLSDDIAFRVALSDWNITAEKYLGWLDAMPANDNLVTVAIDYETFGEHHKPETGIMNFLEHLLLLLAIGNSYTMITPAQAVQLFQPEKTLVLPDYVAVSGCDLSLWVGNDRQREALMALMNLELKVKQFNNAALLREWRHLQATDHFFYMSDKINQASHLSPFSSAEEAFEQYMHALNLLEHRIQTESAEKINDILEAERRHLDTPLWALSIEAHKAHIN
jgi:alpha-amylase